MLGDRILILGDRYTILKDRLTILGDLLSILGDRLTMLRVEGYTKQFYLHAHFYHSEILKAIF